MITILNRPVYTEADAARLLRVAGSTLHYWLEGRGRYQPVIRAEARGGHPDVTWAEFIEAGFLRAYRRELEVPMRELRRFIELLRNEFNVPYPLATEQPWAAGRHLVLEKQREARLAPEWWVLTEVEGQMTFMGPAMDFLRRVEWTSDGVAGSWKVMGEDSPVRVDPTVRFGRPNIAGISTEVVWEHYDAGEGEDEIAAGFGLSEDDVRMALSWELAQRTKQPA